MKYKGHTGQALVVILFAAMVPSACANDDDPTSGSGEAGEASGGAGSTSGGSASGAADGDGAGAAGGPVGGAAGGVVGTQGGAGQGGVGGEGRAGDGGAGGVAASPLQIITVNLPDARVNQTYASAIQAEGGSEAGYVFALHDGALPAGISLSAAGLLTGKPTAEAHGEFSVEVTDSAGGSSVASFSLRVAKHRWAVFTSTNNEGVEPYPTTGLQDLSDLGKPSISVPGCVRTKESLAAGTPDPTFSPAGKWLACGKSFYDARDATLHDPVNVDCTFRRWSPQGDWALCSSDPTHLGFVNVASPSSLTTFGVACDAPSLVMWSPGGNLLQFRCGGTSYVASPHWSAPLTPLTVGNVVPLGFVSEQVLAVGTANGNLGYVRITASDDEPEVIELPLPLAEVYEPWPFVRSNSWSERALIATKQAGGKGSAIVDFKASKVLVEFGSGYLPDEPYAPSPDLEHFLIDSGTTIQVMASADPQRAPTATVQDAGFGVWLADGTVLQSNSPSGALQYTSLSAPNHTAQVVPVADELTARLPEATAADGSFAVVRVGQDWVEGFRIVGIDPAASALQKSTTKIRNPIQYYYPPVHGPVIAPSGRAFAVANCVGLVDDASQLIDAGCSKRVSAWPILNDTNYAGRPADQARPPLAWSSDSSALLYVTGSRSDVNPGGPLAHGLEVASLTDMQHPKILAFASSSSYSDPYQELTWYAVQP